MSLSQFRARSGKEKVRGPPVGPLLPNLHFPIQKSTLLGRFLNNTLQGNKEPAPVFPVFLDCLLQLIIQFPASFEYDHLQLVDLFKQVYCKNFGNNELERARMRERPRFDYFHAKLVTPLRMTPSWILTLAPPCPLAYFWHADLYTNKTALIICYTLMYAFNVSTIHFSKDKVTGSNDGNDVSHVVSPRHQIHSLQVKVAGCPDLALVWPS